MLIFFAHRENHWKMCENDLNINHTVFRYILLARQVDFPIYISFCGNTSMDFRF